LIIGYQHGVYQSVFEMVGEFGVSAERVAKRAVGRLQKLLLANVCVEEHLADQLLLPMLLAGQGSYTTTEPSLHTKTNIQVINLITGVEIQYKPLDGRGWQIVLNRH
jgi:RNA 3'-terminal phosphate cyclase (ATP)